MRRADSWTVGSRRRSPTPVSTASTASTGERLLAVGSRASAPVSAQKPEHAVHCPPHSRPHARAPPLGGWPPAGPVRSSSWCGGLLVTRRTGARRLWRDQRPREEIREHDRAAADERQRDGRDPHQDGVDTERSRHRRADTAQDAALAGPLQPPLGRGTREVSSLISFTIAPNVGACPGPEVPRTRRNPAPCRGWARRPSTVVRPRRTVRSRCRPDRRTSLQSDDVGPSSVLRSSACARSGLSGPDDRAERPLGASRLRPHPGPFGSATGAKTRMSDVRDGTGAPGVVARPRLAWADNLKVALVAGVVVAHEMMAWTGSTSGCWRSRTSGSCCSACC